MKKKLKAKTLIKTKILRAFLAVSITSMLIAGLAAGATMFNLRNAAVDTNHIIGQNAAGSSEKALTDQAILGMRELSGAKAELIDYYLINVADSLRGIGNYINYLYDYKSEFYPARYPYVRDVPEDTLALHWVTAENVPFDQLRDEIYLHGNMKGLYSSVMNVNPDIATIYYMAESGFAAAYDTAASYKPGYYDGRDSEWYVQAKESGGLYISDTYQDAFGRGLTISMSLPCFERDKFVGVIALDILIEELNSGVQKTRLLENVYAMLLGNGQKIISAPGLNEENQNDPAYYFGENSAQILNKMSTDKRGVEITAQNGEKICIVWDGVAVTGWHYVLVVPYDRIIEVAVKNSAEIEELSVQMAREMDRQIFAGTLIFIALFCLIIAIVIYITMRVSQNITRPVSTLNEEIKQLGGGNYDYVSRIDTKDEIEELSLSFESMTKELKDYIENLSIVTAEKERIGAELDVAKNIQASMLPCIFPPFPDQPEVDIYATMLPAKEVGGDFYDFFLIDDTHLGMVIADVSGKGVPAALFMVITKTLIKNYAQMGLSVSEIFNQANNQLCEGNEASMFVTAFMGVLDIKTGEFKYVNAGHNLPCIKKANGDFEFMKAPAGFVLAGMEDFSYKENSRKFDKGDVIYLYTDGVTEAEDEKNNLFSDARLIKTLNQYKNGSLVELLTGVKAEIDAFAGKAPQFDDITMLAVKYEGGEAARKELRLPAATENLASVLDFISKELEKIECPTKAQVQIKIAVEEIFVNIAHYAYHPGVGDATIKCETAYDPPGVVIEFSDSGAPYDPLKKADPDTALSAEERDIGGLGIFMVKKSMDSVEYEYKGGKNILTIKKNF